MSAITPGSVVNLKSGGPDMTVDTIENERYPVEATAYCMWFDSAEPKNGAFRLTSLNLVSSGAEE